MMTTTLANNLIHVRAAEIILMAIKTHIFIVVTDKVAAHLSNASAAFTSL